MRVCLLSLSFVLLSCSVAEPDVEQNMVKFEFVINQEAIVNGLVMLESTLTNNDSELRFLPWNTPFDESLSGRFLRVTEVRADGSKKELAYQGRMVKRRSPSEEDYLVVGTGQMLKNQLDITKSYSFCRNRRYSIGLAGELLDADSQPIKGKFSEVQFQANATFPTCSA